MKNPSEKWILGFHQFWTQYKNKEPPEKMDYKISLVLV